ncbi:MAG TPA: type II secretion system major pseudopilin GspG [Tepidisphaeraceae bacterium]|jgi:general secretion pathway protein G
MMKKTTPRIRTSPSGFTLIELLLVLVILGVLAAIVVPKFTNRSQQARETAAKTDISGVSTALDAFEIDHGRFPTNDEKLDALVTAPPNLPNWKAPYLPRVPKDPWNNPYVYKYPGQKNPSGYDLYSVGPDGRDGGDDDIGNWEK